MSPIVSRIFELSCYSNVSQNRGDGAAYSLQNIQACCPYVIRGNFPGIEVPYVFHCF